MDSYKIEWKRSAAKELKLLPKETIKKILKAIEELSLNPFLPKTKKLIGSEHTFRIRVGDYRIIYDIYSKLLVIEIIRVGHRRDIYER
jgi:mRNA interferase RelE/StbE